MTVWLVRLRTYKNADEKNLVLMRTKKTMEKKKRTKADEKRICVNSPLQEVKNGFTVSIISQVDYDPTLICSCFSFIAFFIYLFL